MTGLTAALSDSRTGRHLVQVYGEDSFLVEAVSIYAAEGLARGEAVLIVATEAHRQAFDAAVAARGQDPVAARASGRLLALDAARTLESFSVDGRPDAESFRRVIGGVLDGLEAAFKGVRVYGEMVDLLWRAGERRRALALEELWNELQKGREFDLLCAYNQDPFGPAGYAGGLQSICRVHSHYFPAGDEAVLDRAVVAAATESLGASGVRMMNALAGAERESTFMPAAQRRLFWLADNMPASTAKILAKVKDAVSAPLVP